MQEDKGIKQSKTKWKQFGTKPNNDEKYWDKPENKSSYDETE